MWANLWFAIFCSRELTDVKDQTVSLCLSHIIHVCAGQIRSSNQSMAGNRTSEQYHSTNQAGTLSELRHSGYHLTPIPH